MKIHKLIFGGMVAVAAAAGVTSCTDDIAVGSDFLDKAPSGSTTQDSVFNNAEYTRQFVASIYSLQYYGIPYRSSNDAPLSASYWKGKLDALTDIYHLNFSGSMVYGNYYTASLTSSTDGPIYGFTTENFWELIRAAYMLIENIDGVPNMEQSEKDRLVAECKCLIASTYFNMFKCYGGLPLVTGTFAGVEGFGQIPRASVERTVKFMTDLLDDASKVLTWAYTGTDAQTQTGRWTKAAAMALKCKILQFAASPLFNSEQAYYGGTTEAEKDSLVWLGGYRPEYWQMCRQACDEFFAELTAKGHYEMVMPTAQTQEAYRYAFRYGYVNQGSPEVIYSVRVTNSTHDSKYQGYTLMYGRNDRYAYTPTQEYVEMFPWRDGTPFDWRKDSLAGRLDTMFVKGDRVTGDQNLQNRVLTRDPRLYETVYVNGVPQQTNWTDGNATGDICENWVGGTDANQQPMTQTGFFGSGYGNKKYVVGSCYDRQFPQWDVIRMSDMYLTYAEALLQADNDFTGALRYIDLVRSRVGMKGLVECNPDKNLTSDKNALLEELLRERACELGFENERYFDLIRYKRADIFGKQLHGLRIWRMQTDPATGERDTVQTQWTNDDKVATANDPTAPGFYEPTDFEFERFAINVPVRVFWTSGFDPKWYLFPFPQTEVNKGYGLIQNPGW